MLVEKGLSIVKGKGEIHFRNRPKQNSLLERVLFYLDKVVRLVAFGDRLYNNPATFVKTSRSPSLAWEGIIKKTEKLYTLSKIIKKPKKKLTT